MRYIVVVGLDGAGKSRLYRSLKWKLGARSYVMHVPSHDFSTSEVVRYVSNECVSRPRLFLSIWQRIQKPMTFSYLLILINILILTQVIHIVNLRRVCFGF